MDVVIFFLNQDSPNSMKLFTEMEIRTHIFLQ